MGGRRRLLPWKGSLCLAFRASVGVLAVLSPLVGCLDAASLLEYRFSEEQPAGTVVGNVLRDYAKPPKYSAKDAAEMRLHFRRTDGNYAHFRLDERTGVLSSGHMIDRESVCPDSDICDVQLDVVVSPERFFQIVKIVVVIDDVNDHDPTFDPDAVWVEVSESASVGSLVSLQGAVDHDSAEYGVKGYDLSPVDLSPFELRVTRHREGGASAVQLRVTGSLDRELRDSYHLVVTANDGGNPPKQGHLVVNVTILDSNDNAPLFDAPTYRVNLSESVPPGSPVVTVHAFDRDLGLNALVFYSFDQQTESLYGRTFKVNSVTGQVTTKASLRQRTGGEDKIHLRVKATDGGSSPLFSVARVTMTVVDTNDRAPEVTVSTLTASGVAAVEEHALIGSFVALVKVRDADKGDAGRVTCQVSPVTDFFLDYQYEGEYTLLTARTFDREAETDPREALIRCEDRGTPPMSSSTRIQVTILDINDHSPRIQDNFRTSVQENNAIGTLLVRLNGSDEDSGPNAELVYQLDTRRDVTADVTASPIVVDRVTGHVTANVVFNYEWRRLYSQRITVCDRGGEQRRCAATTLTVEVEDVNDEPPVFSRATYHFEVPENQPEGTVVGTVTADDADVNLVFRRIVYQLRGGLEDHFAVDPDTGELRTLRSLDRETRSVFRGAVSAVNDGFPSLRAAANVVIRVGDENDNAPSVVLPPPSSEKDPSTIQAPCRAPPGSAIARVEATDPDDGPAGTVTYFLAANSNFTPLFDIDPVTGVITIAPTAHYTLTDCDIYRVTVRATDNGDPRRSTLFDVIISLNASVLPTSTRAEMTSGGETSGGLAALSRHEYAVLFPTLVLGVVLLVVLVASVLLLYHCCYLQKKKKEKRKEKERREEGEEAVEEEEEGEEEVNGEETKEPNDTFDDRIDLHEMAKLKKNHQTSKSRSLYGSGRVVRYVSVHSLSSDPTPTQSRPPFSTIPRLRWSCV